MRRFLMWLLIPVALLVLAVISIVGVRVAAADELPPPSPSLPIVFDDGSSMPLSEVLDRSRRGLPLPIRPPTIRQSLLAGLDFKVTLVADDPEGLLDAPDPQPGPMDDPLYELAEQNRAEGKLDQALALYLSIPRRAGTTPAHAASSPGTSWPATCTSPSGPSSSPTRRCTPIRSTAMPGRTGTASTRARSACPCTDPLIH